MGMLLGKKGKEAAGSQVPLFEVKAQVRRDGAVDLGGDLSITATLLIPGLTPAMLEKMREQVDEKGMLTIGIMQGK